jgi:hypothetical protein
MGYSRLWLKRGAVILLKQLANPKQLCIFVRLRGNEHDDVVRRIELHAYRDDKELRWMKRLHYSAQVTSSAVSIRCGLTERKDILVPMILG